MHYGGSEKIGSRLLPIMLVRPHCFSAILNPIMITGEEIVALATRTAEYSFLLSVVAPIVGGELALLGLAFLAGQGILPLWNIIFGGFLGMFLLDLFWFSVPRSAWGEKMRQKGRNSQKYRDLEAKIESFSHGSDIAILFISKVLVGTRILTLAYLSVRTISLRQFLKYNLGATFLWTVILGYTGWFAGLGYYTVQEAHHNITVGALYIAASVAAFYLIMWAIRRWILTRVRKT